jgi:hypothetical protein
MICVGNVTSIFCPLIIILPFIAAVNAYSFVAVSFTPKCGQWHTFHVTLKASINNLKRCTDLNNSGKQHLKASMKEFNLPVRFSNEGRYWIVHNSKGILYGRNVLIVSENVHVYISKKE